MYDFLSKLARAALCVIICLHAPALLAADDISGAQKAQINDLIRQYIEENPEIIRDALIGLGEKEALAQAQEQARQIGSLANDLAARDDSVVLGNTVGSVTLVEFFDYNCGYCRRAVTDLLYLLDNNPDLRVLLVELPILGPGSLEAARISYAVNQIAPEKFLEFHLNMMSGGRANFENALEIARRLEIDDDQLTAIAQSEQSGAAMAEFVSLADMVGVTGTPAYVLGDELVYGAVGFDVLSEKIDAMRQCGKTAC